MIKRHMMTIAKYPHAKLGKGKPYEGIDNLRPESKETVADLHVLALTWLASFRSFLQVQASHVQSGSAFG